MRLSYCNCSPNSSRDAERAPRSRSYGLGPISRSESWDNANELMSQGAINIDHSRACRLAARPTLSSAAPQKRKDIVENGKMRADFRNLLRYNRNIVGEECFFFLPGRKCESRSCANCVFSFCCLIQLKSLEYNSLRFNVGHRRRGAWRGGRKRWTQIAYLHRERCNTHALEAIFSLPTRGYNVFLGTLINSIHFAQRFLITHCTEP